MNWLRSNWRHVAFAALLITTVASLVSRAGALGRADTWEAVADTLAVENADLRTAHAAASADVAALNDSLAVVREENARVRAESAARIAQATRRASEVATDLQARLDSVGAALFADYQAEIEARDAERVRIIATLEADTAALSLALAEERALSALRLQGWNTSRAEIQALRAANDALRDAVAPSFFTRLWDSKEMVAAAFVLGAVAWEVAR